MRHLVVLSKYVIDLPGRRPIAAEDVVFREVEKSELGMVRMLSPLHCIHDNSKDVTIRQKQIIRERGIEPRCFELLRPRIADCQTYLCCVIAHDIVEQHIDSV